MKHDTIQTAGMAGICTAKSEYGKLKVEQGAEVMTSDGHYQPLTSASPDLAMSPQGHDGQTSNPSYSDDGKRAPAPKANKGGAAMKDNTTLGDAPSLSKDLGLALNNVPKRVVEIDTVKYQKYLDDPALTDNQKEEIIEALWSIMTAFVDLGFGMHPLQEVSGQEACGQLGEPLDQNGEEDSNDPKPASEALQNAFNAASDDT